jgi:hypothetical protein
MRILRQLRAAQPDRVLALFRQDAARSTVLQTYQTIRLAASCAQLDLLLPR